MPVAVDRAALLAATLVLFVPPHGGAARSPIPAATRQLLLVVTDDWAATRGTLWRLRRDGDHFERAGDPIAVSVGRGGLGWGRGLHPESRGEGEPEKREGDGRAPAGVFRLREITGYAPAPPEGATLAYRVATARLRCVDDPASPRYNLLALAPVRGGAPWRSDEAMRRDDALYEWTIVVEHNRGEVRRGAGSCIFLHVHREPGSPTVGCTAMSREALRDLVVWLDGASEPVLVQLPREAFERLRAAWSLPHVP